MVADDFLKIADECLIAARAATSDKRRTSLIDMARVYRDAAVQVVGDPNYPRTPTPPLRAPEPSS